jgi:hypothetical protein
MENRVNISESVERNRDATAISILKYGLGVMVNHLVCYVGQYGHARPDEIREDLDEACKLLGWEVQGEKREVPTSTQRMAAELEKVNDNEKLEAENARLRAAIDAQKILLRPWSSETGECWQCHCQRRGMQHTNGRCRCTRSWKEKTSEARIAIEAVEKDT